MSDAAWPTTVFGGAGSRGSDGGLVIPCGARRAARRGSVQRSGDGSGREGRGGARIGVCVGSRFPLVIVTG